PGGRVDLWLVQGLVGEELTGNRIQLVAVVVQQLSRLIVGLVGEWADLLVHRVEQSVRDAGHARVSSAASFTRLARSAPVIPGVDAAIWLRSTSSAKGTSRV